MFDPRSEGKYGGRFIGTAIGGRKDMSMTEAAVLD